MNRFLISPEILKGGERQLFDLRAGAVILLNPDLSPHQLEMLREYVEGQHITAASLLEFISRTRLVYSRMNGFVRVTSKRQATRYFQEEFQKYQKYLVYRALGMGDDGDIWTLQGMSQKIGTLFHEDADPNWSGMVTIKGDYFFEKFLPDFTDPRTKDNSPRYIEFGFGIYSQYLTISDDLTAKMKLLLGIPPIPLTWAWTSHSRGIQIHTLNHVYLPTLSDPEMTPYVQSALP